MMSLRLIIIKWHNVDGLIIVIQIKLQVQKILGIEDSTDRIIF